MRSRWALYGTVQGVGFRYHTLRHALREKLCGCVWNRSDGAVEIVVEGESEAVARLLQAVRSGPRGARVERLEELEPGEVDLPCPFEISRGAPQT